MVVALAGRIPAGVQQSACAEQGGDPGNLDAVDPVGALALRAGDPIRGDGVNPGLLGMRQVISEDALRRALAATPEAAGIAWLDAHLSDSVGPLLEAPWILDIDTTIKPLYGKQQGAVVSYHPTQPGRPSHAHHSDRMAGLRLVVGAEVRAGNEHSGRHRLSGLLKILDDLPAARRPRIVRGDGGYGSDPLMAPLEARGHPTCASGGCRRTSNAPLSASSGTPAGRMPARAGKGCAVGCACPAGNASAASSCCAGP